MTRGKANTCVKISALIVATCVVSSSLAQQVRPARLPVVRMTAPELRQSFEKTDSAAYTYTLLSYPGSLSTQGVGIKPGTVESETEIVGDYKFPDGVSQTGFRVRVRDAKVVTESYEPLKDPAGPISPQQAYGINDEGQVVGDYIDSAQIFHAYVLDCGEFKPLDVPFAGAAGTYSPGINDLGEIVGSWFDSVGTSHGFTLIRGEFASFDYPGSIYTVASGINLAGHITGYWIDVSGGVHGFLKQGDKYESVDFPGAIQSFSFGINDSDELVGGYCMTTLCANTGEGQQGFVLKNGVFTSINIPGEFATGLAAINNKGVLLGAYLDASGLLYTFLAAR